MVVAYVAQRVMINLHPFRFHYHLHNQRNQGENIILPFPDLPPSPLLPFVHTNNQQYETKTPKSFILTANYTKLHLIFEHLRNESDKEFWNGQTNNGRDVPNIFNSAWIIKHSRCVLEARPGRSHPITRLNSFYPSHKSTTLPEQNTNLAVVPEETNSNQSYPNTGPRHQLLDISAAKTNYINKTQSIPL